MIIFENQISIIRILDFFLATLGLLILLPVLMLVFFAGFFDSCNPIFRQKRLGRNLVPFTILKFRTMVPDTPNVATELVNPGSVTRLGRFLRNSKLDELPQLYNVLKGDMSLVGPRPGLLNQDSLTAARIKLGVFEVRPGITGLAQIRGIDMSTSELLAQTDAEMISQMSVFKYFKYIFLTLAGKGSGDRIRS